MSPTGINLNANPGALSDFCTSNLGGPEDAINLARSSFGFANLSTAFACLTLAAKIQGQDPAANLKLHVQPQADTNKLVLQLSRIPQGNAVLEATQDLNAPWRPIHFFSVGSDSVAISHGAQNNFYRVVENIPDPTISSQSESASCKGTVCGTYIRVNLNQQQFLAYPPATWEVTLASKHGAGELSGHPVGLPVPAGFTWTLEGIQTNRWEGRVNRRVVP